MTDRYHIVTLHWTMVAKLTSSDRLVVLLRMHTDRMQLHFFSSKTAVVFFSQTVTTRYGLTSTSHKILTTSCLRAIDWFWSDKLVFLLRSQTTATRLHLLAYLLTAYQSWNTVTCKLYMLVVFLRTLTERPWSVVVRALHRWTVFRHHAASTAAAHVRGWQSSIRHYASQGRCRRC